VDDQTISRFGAIDPTDGGKTSRYSVSLDRHKTLANGAVFHMDVYAIKYRLNLFSNFTILSQRSTNGDQFEQADSRTVVGLTPRWVFNGSGMSVRSPTSSGSMRAATTSNVALYDTTARDRRSPVRSDKSSRPGVGLYYENAIRDRHFSQHPRACARISTAPAWTTLSAGARERRTRISPRPSSVLFSGLRQDRVLPELRQGFHSNDARGTTITLRPRCRPW